MKKVLLALATLSALSAPAAVFASEMKWCTIDKQTNSLGSCYVSQAQCDSYKNQYQTCVPMTK